MLNPLLNFKELNKDLIFSCIILEYFIKNRPSGLLNQRQHAATIYTSIFSSPT